MSFVRSGDTVIVHSMDRLARNLDDLRRIVQILTGKGIRIEFIKEHLTFTGEDSPIVCQSICLWTGGVKMAISTFETLPILD
jgi:DNA invertase Pin-like site-specific DNA recombinase